MPRGLFFSYGGAETEEGKGISSGTIGALKARFPVLVNAESAVEKKRRLASPTLGGGSLPARKGWLSGPSAEPADGSGPGGATCRLLSRALKSPPMAPLSQTRRSRGFSPAPAPPLLKTAISERDDLSACPPAVDGECLSPFPFHGPFHGALPDRHHLRGATISGSHAPLSAL